MKTNLKRIETTFYSSQRFREAIQVSNIFNERVTIMLGKDEGKFREIRLPIRG